MEESLDEFWKRNSLAGSPYYIAPEIIDNAPISYASDYWSLGVLIYKLIHGYFPFENDYLYISNKFTIDNIKFKEGLEPECIDFLKKLLVKNPN